MDRAGRRTVAATFPVPEGQRAAFLDELSDLADVAFVADLDDGARLAALRGAEAILSWMWEAEVREDERSELPNVRFIQLVSAGADGVPFGQMPAGVSIAGNVGAYAEPMAEHAMALALALAKRLPQRHAELARGEYRHFAFGKGLEGSVAGILGYGGIGRAVARRMRAFGARIHAVNTSGSTGDQVEFVGTLDDLDQVLRAADVLIIALPLTRATRGLIGDRELGLMKSDAILVNVARAAIVDERALFDHLRWNPDFMAGLDVWWREPLSHGEFEIDHPFFELPNVLGTPHNSALVPGSLEAAARSAARNVRRHLLGEPVRGLVRREDY